MITTQNKTAVHIRWQIRHDMPAVLAIEADSFEFPWLDEDFIRFLRHRNCIGMVAEHSGRIVGYMEYELCLRGIRLHNLAVARLYRRMGIGSQMVKELLGKLNEQRRKWLSVKVRERNVVAQLFFLANKLRAVAILHGDYEDCDDDAYVMCYRRRVCRGR